jgi:hypothetical protein
MVGAIYSRLNTSNMLRRRRKVSRKVIIVSCASVVLRKLLNIFSLLVPLRFVWEENLNVHQKLYQAKREFGQPFFMEVFVIGVWCLWNQGNEVIFDRKAPCLAAWKVAFKAQVLDHLVIIKPSLHPLSNFGFKLCNFWLLFVSSSLLR